METAYRPNDSDVKRVLEAHGLLPEGPLLDEAIGIVVLYADLIQKHVADLPVSINRQKALLAILEEGFMQEGIIPNAHKRQFEMPVA